ncbi:MULTISPECIES: polyprenol phosphomannose-dependent alpha 1,6 mannosyltransferase MptB [Flavobacterium]|uniref:Polyprenol phosphomannose-dependent alpha 1,6 mannosyltransferase MptB n=1 Tax=Flavobacterium jumunjinense TaxID=998845 RepID=A0ABV5GU25_9FLAO|nr:MULTISPECIES: polyprenol phosphomannose-dependent alpha 1,6 mannosyltransferase MptB [Flavobacterium]
MSFLNIKYKGIVLILISFVAYVVLGYFVPRDSFNVLFFLYSLAFVSFCFIYKSQEFKENQLFAIGSLFRLVLLFCLPFWSQDFYRFIWDGRLILSGISPYAFLPNDIIDTVPIAQSKELYDAMGNLSASHYSNYPPINQFFFAIAAFFASKSIFFAAFVLKLIVLFADLGIYFFGKKLLLLLNRNPKTIFLYFLNPLVIIELTGNLHFEGVMLFFLLLGFYFFFLNKWLISALFITLSISTKLLPLLLLPFFYQKLGFKKSVLFYLVIISFNVLLFLPFVSKDLIANYSETISLWFVNFEFNASLYYVFREIGFYVKGYNTIGIIGKVIPVVSILVILFYSLYKNNLSMTRVISNGLIALSIYFFLSTTIHPWYVINLLLLAVFTQYKYPLYWSFFVVLSYFAYSQESFKESVILLFIEYLFVFGVFIYELKFKTIKNNLA